MRGIWIIWNLLGETKGTLSGITDADLIKFDIVRKNR